MLLSDKITLTSEKTPLMPNINSVILAGTIVSDPYLYQYKWGDQLVFTLLVKIQYPNLCEITYIPIVAARHITPTLLPLLKKGDSVTIYGSIKYKSWTTDKVKKTSFHVNAFRIDHLHGNPKPSQNTSDDIKNNSSSIPY